MKMAEQLGAERHPYGMVKRRYTIIDDGIEL